jgi:hypothetical protein
MIGIGSLRRHLAALLVVLNLVACGATGGHAGNYLPGGAEYFSLGTALDKDYYERHVKRVQYAYARFQGRRTWIDTLPPANPSAYNMLQAYVPLNVRWELKDGRQFIAEDIDVGTVMREYLKHNDLKVQWQREGRQWAPGDSDPAVVFDVREDEVILKWLITINKTPFDQRILPSGAATRWTFEYEQHVAGRVKGTPTQGIDFEQRYDLKRPSH